MRWAIAVGLVVAFTSSTTADDSPALKSITQKELKYHASMLASDPFEGREAGSRGGMAAGVYITTQLKKFKSLQPAGSTTKKHYGQSFGVGYRNVLAILPGSDAKLKDEYILVCAHYDHVGYGNETNSFGPIGYIHNGADDNASGTAGLLEIIDAFTRLKTPPKRSILFAFWDAEEKGLLGSEHWLRKPTIQLKQLKLVINMDMIGRVRKGKVEIQGTRSGVGLRRFISRANREEDLLLDFQWKCPRESDHYPFLQKGIPGFMFHSGKHTDYHRPSDDSNKLNVAGMQQITRMTFQVARAAADAQTLFKHRSSWQNENEYGRRRLTKALQPLPYRFGVTWDPKIAKTGVIKIVSTTFNGPASIAGVKAGDQVLKVNGVAVKSELQFHQLILAAFNPTRVTVKRGDKTQDLDVKLNGSPYRVGLAWDIDQAEPEAFIVRRIIPGSPSDVAGVKVGDRIHAVNGTSVGSVKAFRKAIGNAGDKLTFDVERNGYVRTVTLKLLAKTTTAPKK